jgi:WD40 repeat protein
MIPEGGRVGDGLTADAAIGSGDGWSPPPRMPKYWAFVSYSHHDRHWGEWLHRAIETYRVPRKLVGQSSPVGKIPRRLAPIFRDCAELPAAPNLGARLEEALRSSRYLVVVCSPSAAASPWVNQEVRTFKAANGEDRILCLIVDGEPNTVNRLESKELECLPEALRSHAVADRDVSRARSEPLAADVRSGHDSKITAKLRLIAGLIGVSFDELRQRELRRRRWRRAQLTFAALTVLAMIAGVWQWQEVQKEQQHRLQTIENFVSLGQTKVQNGDFVSAAVLLGEAYMLGGDSRRLRYLLARALPAIDVQAATLQASGPPVVAATFDPHGRYLLSLSQPSQAKVWDATAGRLIGTLKQHQAPITSATFSHDGQHVVTTSYDRTARIWEASTARLISTLDRHPSLLDTALYSPDDSLLLTLGVDATARLWDPASGKLLRELPGGARRPATFSPDGSMLVTTQILQDAKHLIVFRDTATGRVVRALEGHQGIRDAQFSRNGERLVTAGEDGSLRIWDATSGDPQTTWISGDGPLIFAAFLSDDRTVVVLSETGTIYRYDSKKQQILDQRETGLRPVRLAAFDPGRGWLVLIGPEGVPSVWETYGGGLLAKLQGLGGQVLCASINSRAPHIVTGAADGTIVTWDLSRRARALNLSGHGQMVNVARFSPDAKWILTAGSDSKARIWNAETGEPVAMLAGHDAAVTDAKFDATTSLIVTLSLDGAMGWWSVEDWQLLRMIKDANVEQIELSQDGRRLLLIYGRRYAALIDRESLKAVATVDGRMELRSGAVSNDGRLLAVGSEDGTIDLRDARTGALIKLLWAHSGSVHSLHFSADSSRLLSAGADGSALVWAVPDGEVIAAIEGQPDDLVSARFSSDGGRVVTASRDKGAKIWSADDGRFIASLSGHNARVSFAKFSPDGKLVATGSDDRTVKIWDADSGQLLQSLEGHEGEILSAEFSTDGERLISGAKDPVARVWEVGLERRSPREVEELILRRVPRAMQAVAEPARAMSPQSPTDHRGNSGGSSLGAASDVSTDPQSTVLAFVRALADGDSDRVASLIASNYEPHLERLRSRTAGTAELSETADLFVGATIAQSVLRKDRNAALVDMDHPEHRLSVYLSKEGNAWRIAAIHGRPSEKR